jgi:hypothetical protein
MNFTSVILTFPISLSARWLKLGTTVAAGIVAAIVFKNSSLFIIALIIEVLIWFEN